MKALTDHVVVAVVVQEDVEIAAVEVENVVVAEVEVADVVVSVDLVVTTTTMKKIKTKTMMTQLKTLVALEVALVEALEVASVVPHLERVNEALEKDVVEDVGDHDLPVVLVTDATKKDIL